jgi:hypothetical protein
MNHDQALHVLLQLFPTARIDTEPPRSAHDGVLATAGTEDDLSRTDHARRARVIAYAREGREVQLAPLRAEIVTLISDLGWQRARPIVGAVLGHAPKTARGPWLRRIGTRRARQLVAALRALPAQVRLPM